MKRIFTVVLSVIVSFPVAVISGLAADKSGLPEWMLYFVSPGYLLGLRFMEGSLTRFMNIAVAANMLLYGTILYFLLRRIFRGIHFPKSDQFWMQD